MHDLSIGGSENVTVKSGKGAGIREICGIGREVESVEWTDNGEKLEFSQNIDEKTLSINATAFPYGTNTVVRVAKISYK